MTNEAIPKIYLNFGAQINDFLQYWKGVALVWSSFLDSTWQTIIIYWIGIFLDLFWSNISKTSESETHITKVKWLYRTQTIGKSSLSGHKTALKKMT